MNNADSNASQHVVHQHVVDMILPNEIADHHLRRFFPFLFLLLALCPLPPRLRSGFKDSRGCSGTSFGFCSPPPSLQTFSPDLLGLGKDVRIKARSVK